MANILDKFKDTSIGSSGRILDFTGKVGSDGDFNKIYDISVIITSWNNILMTPKGSCDHDPEFGSDLHLFLFEPADVQTQDAIKDEIYRSLTSFDDRASISDIKVSFLKNKKGFSVSINVNYLGVKSNYSKTIDETTFQNYMQ